jgi:hypothetical protein
VTLLTLVRNDVIEWNAIVVTASMMRIVAFAGGGTDDGCG